MRASRTSSSTSVAGIASAIARRALFMWPGYHWIVTSPSGAASEHPEGWDFPGSSTGPRRPVRGCPRRNHESLVVDLHRTSLEKSPHRSLESLLAEAENTA